MAQSDSDQTPLMKQYLELKRQSGDAMLLFRMGDFYELFGDDAVEAARILEITLTSRDKNKPNPIPMAGVPHHSAQNYIQRLLKAGKKVAIGEQMEDPAKVTGPKAIVKRAIVRTFTPGVQFDHEGAEANYLAALTAAEGDRFCLAVLDVSTGECLSGGALSAPEAATELGALPVRHLLRPQNLSLPTPLEAAIEALSGPGGALVETLPSNYLSLAQATKLLQTHYAVESLAAFLATEHEAQALGLLVTYALRTQQQERLAHLRVPAPLRRPRTLALGPRTAQHLDLLPGPDNGPNLYSLLNRTRSALGARQLKRWLVAPMKTPAEIRARQDAVRELSQEDAAWSDKVSAQLAQVYDLERILGRVNARLANPRDTLALGRSLAVLPALASLLADSDADGLRALHGRLEDLAGHLYPLGVEITRNQREDAPLTAREGGIFNAGTSPELDHLLSLTENGQRWLVDLETRERQSTGIPSLKVRYNRVFGYYLEVTQSHLKHVPSHYQRKQTTVGAERFFTEELKKFEDEILNSATRQRAVEGELFETLLKSVQDQTALIMEVARVFGELDALLSLAMLAREPGWVFPSIDDSLDLEIRAGRHPLVDGTRTGAPTLGRGLFVPNDLSLSPGTRLTLMITGPNMGGKSTVMRQTALIMLLGQMGAPVPAVSARWGVVSSIFTRIGAHDAIARGQSTFMVEMSELAHILHYADERSLIILDEIGRGTSTYDGISVAWSTLEWICTQIRARTLFATHYHELTRLADVLPALANAHMAVEGARSLAGASGGLRFLYKLKEGPTADSFGIHVARIAGLPKPVIERAWKVLEELESNSFHDSAQASTSQLSLFDAGEPAEAASAAASSASPRKRGQRLRAREDANFAETAADLDSDESDSAGDGDRAITAMAAAAIVIPPHPVQSELDALNVNELTPLQALTHLARLQEMSRAPASTSA